MDDSTFDRLTRHLGTTASRRAGLGLTLGAATGAFVSLFGMDERDARGKGKGKSKGKKKNKKKNGDSQQPAPGCPEASTDCGAGVCASPGECCPGEKSCGGGCIRVQDCCPYTERVCIGGGCVPHDACCPRVEQRCGAECCVLGEECCNGSCSVSNGGICTQDGWCPPVTGWACCDGSVADCSTSPCCNVTAGEICCVTSTDPVIETTCCPGGGDQCARGGCCPVGTKWKGDCEACCTNGTTACTSCRAPVGGRG